MVADRRVSCFIAGLAANSGGDCVLQAFPLACRWFPVCGAGTSSQSEDWGDLSRHRDFQIDDMLSGTSHTYKESFFVIMYLFKNMKVLAHHILHDFITVPVRSYLSSIYNHVREMSMCPRRSGRLRLDL